MPGFLSLPRELRDMVYTALLTNTRPKPTLHDTQSISNWTRVWEPSSIHRGEWGCTFSLSAAPNTCASFLVSSRQVHDEMTQAIERARRKSLLAATLDCLAHDESFHYFTWLSIPLVKTARCLAVEGKTPTWTDRMMGGYRYLTAPHRVLGKTNPSSATTTTIQLLCIDIRLSGDRSAKWLGNHAGPERTSWAVCAALKRLFDRDR
ncbi:hypothetical protein P153DRAFT_254883, partial [Dothidotthia symphoricarpi CBS 119687]